METIANPSDSNASSPAATQSTFGRFNKWMKPVRRAHMYLGLLLLPWVLLFGASGFLFNHNTRTFGGPFETLKEMSASEVSKAVTWKPVPADQLAGEVVGGINEKAERATFTLKPGTAEVVGGVIHETRVEDGVVWVRLNLEEGNATVLHRSEMGAEQHVPAFQDQEVRIASVDRAALAEVSRDLLMTTGAREGSPWKLIGAGQPILRFQVADQSGQSWNAVYNLATGKLNGRASEDETGMSLFRAATRLHTTHVYPERMGARWVWVLIADAAGLAMIVWSVTGLAMWWQIKRSRVLGALAISVMLLVAAVIFTGTLNDHTFGRDPIARKVRPSGSESEEKVQSLVPAPAQRDGDPAGSSLQSAFTQATP